MTRRPLRRAAWGRRSLRRAAWGGRSLRGGLGRARLAWRRAEQDPDHVSFEVFDQTWQPITATEHRDGVAAAAKGLIASGVEPGDRVAIMAGTSYAWIQLDCAVWAAGGATVPIYPSSSASQAR